MKLRRRGLSLHEIQKQIPGLPKATLSGWIHRIDLSDVQQQRILCRIDEARFRACERAGLVNHEKKAQRVRVAHEEAESEYRKLRHHPSFLAGLMLYWAEGSKTQEWFQFMNSDPRLIRFMIRWLREICNIPPELITARLYTHRIYAHQHPERKWMKLLELPSTNMRRTIYKPTPHTTKKNPSYLGCMRIQVTRAHLFRKISRWVQLFTEEYDLD